jgi:hypothetical protein
MSTNRQDEDRERREVLERQQKSLSAALTEYDAAEDIGIEVSFGREFEVKGIDVLLWYKIRTIQKFPRCQWHCEEETRLDFLDDHFNVGAIEIKPSVGDDYPTILRQMRSIAIYCLRKPIPASAQPRSSLSKPSRYPASRCSFGTKLRPELSEAAKD